MSKDLGSPYAYLVNPTRETIADIAKESSVRGYLHTSGDVFVWDPFIPHSAMLSVLLATGVLLFDNGIRFRIDFRDRLVVFSGGKEKDLRESYRYQRVLGMIDNLEYLNLTNDFPRRSNACRANPQTSQTGLVLFHVTNLASVLSMLESDKILFAASYSAEKQFNHNYPFFLSTSRTLSGNFIRNRLFNGNAVIVLDWELIRANYRTSSVDYFAPEFADYNNIQKMDNQDWSESEERILSRQESISSSRYIREILIPLFKGCDYPYIHQYDASFLRKIALAARKLKISLKELLIEPARPNGSAIPPVKDFPLEQVAEWTSGSIKSLFSVDKPEGTSASNTTKDLMLWNLLISKHPQEWPLWARSIKNLERMFGQSFLLYQREHCSAIHNSRNSNTKLLERSLVSKIHREAARLGFATPEALLRDRVTELKAKAKEVGLHLTDYIASFWAPKVRHNPSSRSYWGNAGAGILPFCPASERFLLSYRSEFVKEPHTWGVWGGAIEEGETPEAAACREAHEELGLDCSPKDLRLLYDFRDGSFSYSTFIVAVEEEFEPGEFDWETEGAEWMALDEIEALPNLHFGVKALLPTLRGLT